MTTGTRTQLKQAIEHHKAHLGELQTLVNESQRASDYAQSLRTELTELEAQADEAVAASIASGAATTEADIQAEARLAALKRRIAAAENAATAKMQAASEQQTATAAAGVSLRWRAREVLVQEAEALIDKYRTAQTEALSLRWQAEKLAAHLVATRGGSENAARPTFNSNVGIITRLRNILHRDETEHWPVHELPGKWESYEAALLGDPQAQAPDMVLGDPSVEPPPARLFNLSVGANNAAAA